MSRSKPRLRTVATVVIALLLIAGLVAPAFAHAQLLSSDPADGATLPTTDRVVLTFSEDISSDFVQVVLTGPDGAAVASTPTVAGAVVTAPLTPGSSGTYALSYRVVSADGHPISGRIGFTLTDVPAAAAPAPTSEASTPQAPTTPERATAVSSAAAPAAAGADTDAADGSGAPTTWLVGGLALAALAGAGTWLARRRRHPEH